MSCEAAPAAKPCISGAFRTPTWAPVRRLAEAQDGVNLVVRIAQGPELSILIADMQGRPIHEWTIDWFTIWPDATHIPRQINPGRDRAPMSMAPS